MGHQPIIAAFILAGLVGCRTFRPALPRLTFQPAFRRIAVSAVFITAKRFGGWVAVPCMASREQARREASAGLAVDAVSELVEHTREGRSSTGWSFRHPQAEAEHRGPAVLSRVRLHGGCAAGALRPADRLDRGAFLPEAIHEMNDACGRHPNSLR